MTNVSQAVGKLTIFSIPKDGQVLSSQLIALGDPNADTTNNKKLSLILEPGDYALSVPVTLIDAVSYFPRENDYVDVYLVEKVTPSEVGQTDVNGSTYEEEDTKVKLIVEQVRILRFQLARRLPQQQPEPYNRFTKSPWTEQDSGSGCRRNGSGHISCTSPSANRISRQARLRQSPHPHHLKLHPKTSNFNI